MSEYRFILQPYTGPGSRYQCPECGKQRVFVRYVDTVTGEHLHPDVGRCNREEKCGYHFTPSDYFRDNGITPGPSDHIPLPEPRKEPSFIDSSLMKRSLKGYDENIFVQFLYQKFPHDAVEAVVKQYRIGTSRQFGGGSIIFWQIDSGGKIRSGKIMKYGPDGKREKWPDGKAKINWVHTATHIDNFNLSQCLFGLHLIKEYPDKTICLVESEKTALIASIAMPDYLWMATGGNNGARWSDPESFSVLEGRTVILFPDLDKVAEWTGKAENLRDYANVIVSDFLPSVASDEDIENGADLADFILKDSALCIAEASKGASQGPGPAAGILDAEPAIQRSSLSATGEPAPVAFDNCKPARKPVDIMAPRRIWTDEECAMYFGHGRKMNLASRDETLAAIREGVRKYQQEYRKKHKEHELRTAS